MFVNTHGWSKLINFNRNHHIIINCVILHQLFWKVRCSEHEPRLQNMIQAQNTQCGKAENCNNALCGKVEIGRWDLESQ